VANKTGHTLEDKYLVEKVLGGDTYAFSAIVKNTETLVAQIVFRMVNNAEDRKDIVQDIYLKTFHKLPGFHFGSKLSTWIGQIAYNTCFDYLRKKKLVFLDNIQGNEEHEDEYREERFNGMSEDNIESSFMRKELSGLLKAEIEKIPPIYKTLVILYHNEELSYAEIGEITNLPEGTLKSYLFRARKMLKENLLAKFKKEEL